MKAPLGVAVRRISLSVSSGILSGLAATLFLVLLERATQARESNALWLYFLPFGGLLIGWLYHRHGREAEQGSNLILEEIHNPANTVPVRMAPLVLFGTVVTHLSGGSAGREGTAVQMGGSLADQLAHRFRVSSDERRALLSAGMGAGFGAAIGAPWAGVIFGMEVIQVGRIKFFAFFECLIAAPVAFLVTKLLQAPHTVFPEVVLPALGPKSLGASLLSGVVFGVLAMVSIRTTHLMEGAHKRWVSFPPLRPFFGGLVLVPLFLLEGTHRFTGLGIPVIQDALRTSTTFDVPLLKLLFTALTLGSGFKGGEFIPLVFMGATLGSAISGVLPGDYLYLGALGAVATFGAASNTPIACTILAMELFGPNIAPYAAVACFTANYASFDHTIYSSQRR